MNISTKVYIYVLFVTFSLGCLWWISSYGIGFSLLHLGTAAGLALACLLARKFPLEFKRNTVEIVDVAVLTAMFALGPVWALLVAVPSFVFRERLRTMFTSGADGMSILLAGATFGAFSSPVLDVSAPSEGLVYGAVLGGAVFYLSNAFFNALLLRFKYESGVLAKMRESLAPLVAPDIIAVLAALGTAYVTVAFGPAAALVLFLGGTGALISLHLIHTRQIENEQLREENAALLSANVGFVASLVGTLGEKHAYVARNSVASSVYAGDVAREFGFDRKREDLVRVAALLQDAGLFAVPDAVVRVSPQRLNPDGRTELARHPELSERLLAGVPGFEEAAQWVRWHHERLDGSGFPDGVRGRWLPLEARMLAVAEVYASLVLDTPEAPALSPEEARFTLTSLAGESLDREVVKALLRLLDREDEAYARATGERFARSVPDAARSGLSRTGTDGHGTLRVVGR